MHGRLAVVVVAIATVAFAQTSRGVITGAVFDSSGAAVAGATVDLAGVDTGIHQFTRTNEAGVYRFDAVDPGSYTLSVTHPGFKTFVADGLGAQANRTTTIDPHLEVGDAASRVDVSVENGDLLTRDSPLRGANFDSRQAVDMPLISQNPLSLARTLPGATEAFGSTVWSAGYASNGGAATTTNSNGAGFSINGQRPRGNNYLLDGTTNNEIWISGEQQTFSIADAIEEVSVQTANFGVEFGRAGGAVFNVITRSGTNDLHGTLFWRYQSERFDSVSNYNKLNHIPQSVFSSNNPGFTVGGPIRRNKIFFFTGFEQNNTHSTANYPMQIPAAGAVSQLNSLFPGNPELALYLYALGSLRGTANLFPVQLGTDPATQANRGFVEFGTGAYVLPSVNDGPQWLARVDQATSANQHLSWRLTGDSRVVTPDNRLFALWRGRNSMAPKNIAHRLI